MPTVPASIRYKNPGAMWGGNAISKRWGEIGNVALNDGLGQNNHIAVFPSYANGIAAQIDLWRTPRYRNKRLADAIKIWSGGNWVDSYLTLIHRYTPQITADTIINDALLSSPLGISFLKGQAYHEAGREYPATDADWIKGQQMAFGVKPAPVKNDPKPKAATVSTGGGGTGTVVAAQQAAASGWPWWAVLLLVLAGLGITGFAAWWFYFRHEEIKTGGGQTPVFNPAIGDTL